MIYDLYRVEGEKDILIKYRLSCPDAARIYIIWDKIKCFFSGIENPNYKVINYAPKNTFFGFIKHNTKIRGKIIRIFNNWSFKKSFKGVVYVYKFHHGETLNNIREAVSSWFFHEITYGNIYKGFYSSTLIKRRYNQHKLEDVIVAELIYDYHILKDKYDYT